MDSMTPTRLLFPVGAVAGALLVAACAPDYQPKVESRSTQGAAVAPSGETASAVFAGGCFWCTEAAFEKVADRKSVVWGKSVSVRVDLGGSRIIKEKNTKSRRRGGEHNIV